MKKLSLLIASAAISSAVMANELNLPPLENSSPLSITGTVKINGTTYQKLSYGNHGNSPLAATRSLTNNHGLFAGDLVRKGKLAYVERISGSFIISGNNGAAVQQAAKAHGLTVQYTISNKAVVVAPEGKELTAILSALRNDSRVHVAKLERVSQKMQPE